MEELFAVNRAAYVLGKDRATVTRAVRFVPPDGYQGNHPRWTMASITAALALTPQARRNARKSWNRYRIPSKALGELRFNFEKQVALISVEPSLDRRREMALALAPLLHEHQTTYLDIGRSLRIADDDVLGARAELIWSEMMDEVSEAAAWPLHSDDFLLNMIQAMPSHPDDDEAA